MPSTSPSMVPNRAPLPSSVIPLNANSTSPLRPNGPPGLVPVPNGAMYGYHHPQQYIHPPPHLQPHPYTQQHQQNGRSLTSPPGLSTTNYPNHPHHLPPYHAHHHQQHPMPIPNPYATTASPANIPASFPPPAVPFGMNVAGSTGGVSLTGGSATGNMITPPGVGMGRPFVDPNHHGMPVRPGVNGHHGGYMHPHHLHHPHHPHHGMMPNGGAVGMGMPVVGGGGGGQGRYGAPPGLSGPHNGNTRQQQQQGGQTANGGEATINSTNTNASNTTNPANSGRNNGSGTEGRKYRVDAQPFIPSGIVPITTVGSGASGMSSSGGIVVSSGGTSTSGARPKLALIKRGTTAPTARMARGPDESKGFLKGFGRGSATNPVEWLPNLKYGVQLLQKPL